MKMVCSLFAILCIISSCKKSIDPKPYVALNVRSSYSATVAYGNNTYSVSHFTTLQSNAESYLIDSLMIGFAGACSSNITIDGYWIVRFNDTVRGREVYPNFLTFPIPRLGNFSNYSEQWVTMVLKDTLYNGTAIIDGKIAPNSDQTVNGSFSIRAVISNEYNQVDSIPMTATMDFTNMPFQ